MNNLLKGNYEVENKTGTTAALPSDDKQDFEDKAMERLGGSIAFVMKGNKFVWDEDNEDGE